MAANPNELTIEDTALILVDHQPAVALCAPSLRTDVLINNVAGLAKSAKLLGVPTVLTTVGAQGRILADPIFKEIGEISRRSLPSTGPRHMPGRTLTFALRSKRRGERSSSWS